MNNRAAAHRILKVRQNPLPSGSDGSGGPTGPAGGGDTPSSTPPPPPSSTKSPTKPTPSPTSSSTRSQPSPPPPTRTTTTKTPDPTTPTTAATSTAPQSSSDSHSNSSSSESTSPSVSVSNASSSTTTSTGTTLIPATANTPVQFLPTSVASPTIISTDGPGAATESPTSTDLTASGGIKTGAVVGGVVGAIGAIAIIGMIVAFFLRRWRRSRGGDDSFDAGQFVRSPSMMDTEFRDSPAGTPYRASTFDPNPPSMAQHGHTNMASVSSGAGMAGHGAYATATAMQQQPQYTYGNSGYDAGHARDDEGSEIAHGGPYSSEPQPQHSYNPEAYGSFAYSTEGSHAVQQQQYHPYQAQPHYPEYRDVGPAPALVAGAPAVPAGRSSRQSVAVNDDDVYGGI